MKQPAKLALALLGIAGIWDVPALQAQPASQPAYVVAEVHVTDPAGFTDYVKQLPATLAAYHAKTLVRALPDMREGAPPDGQVVIIAFDSLADANRWYSSPAYRAIIPLRQKSAATKVYTVAGLAQ